jgi:hypothetical protein
VVSVRRLDALIVGVMSGYAKERALDRIVRLARRHQDLATFWRESSAVINSTIPNYQGPCWFTMDPASLLVTSHFNDYMPQLPADWEALEYYEDDVLKLAEGCPLKERDLDTARGDQR